MKNLILVFALFLGISASAQTAMVKKFTNGGVPFYVTSDTVTNTGTNFLTNRYIVSGQAQNVTICWTATKQSGTVAGTVTLKGSMDGTNFVTISGTNMYGSDTYTTFTATDVATQTNCWTIRGNPFPYYRISWTGAGTMAATQTASFVAH